jgi:hypothetical protein
MRPNQILEFAVGLAKCRGLHRLAMILPSGFDSRRIHELCKAKVIMRVLGCYGDTFCKINRSLATLATRSSRDTSCNGPKEIRGQSFGNGAERGGNEIEVI